MKWRTLFAAMIISALITIIIVIPIALPGMQQAQVSYEKDNEYGTGGGSLDSESIDAEAVQSITHQMIIFIVIGYCILTGIIYFIIDRYKSRNSKSS